MVKSAPGIPWGTLYRHFKVFQGFLVVCCTDMVEYSKDSFLKCHWPLDTPGIPNCLFWYPWGIDPYSKKTKIPCGILVVHCGILVVHCGILVVHYGILTSGTLWYPCGAFWYPCGALWYIVVSLWCILVSLWYIKVSLWYIMVSLWYPCGTLWYPCGTLWYPCGKKTHNVWIIPARKWSVCLV
jgi:hypothetical protein